MVAQMERGNLFAGVPVRLEQEQFDVLARAARAGGVRIERIVSRGQVSAGWYDQEQDEWVALLSGAARLEFEQGGEITMGRGDWLLIRAHEKHRVVYTSSEEPCVWIAVHYGPELG
jgi:cupin 2 domain-containing protein